MLLTLTGTRSLLVGATPVEVVAVEVQIRLGRRAEAVRGEPLDRLVVRVERGFRRLVWVS
jgi:hypothetical protein